MKRIVIAAAVAAGLVAPALHAEDVSVARLVGVSGNVLVSTESSIASAGEALRLVPGMRVIATMNSRATVQYHDGCRVDVAAGERFEVRPDAPCDARAGRYGGAYASVRGARP
jgi:hypothetical protein